MGERMKTLFLLPHIGSFAKLGIGGEPITGLAKPPFFLTLCLRASVVNFSYSLRELKPANWVADKTRLGVLRFRVLCSRAGSGVDIFGKGSATAARRRLPKEGFKRKRKES